MDTNAATSIITSNVSGLNTPTNRQRGFFFFFLKKTQVLVVYKRHFKYEDKDVLKLKEWRKIYYANTNQKSRSSYIRDESDFKTKQKYYQG